VSRAPLVLVTSIPRSVATTLGVEMDNATVHQRFGALIAAGGGIAVMSDAWGDPRALVERVDAVVLNGGSDVDPRRYGAPPLAATDPPDVRRDDFELGLVRAARERGLPLLGVCRGMHLLNVCRGGTLVQDLAARTDVEHYANDRHERPVHGLEIERGSALARAAGRLRTTVNSVHHQAIDALGTGLKVSARAPDGVIEAIEDESGLALGVQWHPEFLAGEAGDQQVGLFEALTRREETPR